MIPYDTPDVIGFDSAGTFRAQVSYDTGGYYVRLQLTVVVDGAIYALTADWHLVRTRSCARNMTAQLSG